MLAIVVTLTCVVTFMQNAKSEALMDSFKKFVPQQVKVRRDNKDIDVDAKRLVPGDIIFLKDGDKIAADVRVIQSFEMKVDNSSLTGESKLLLRTTECTNKNNALETANLAFFGTICKGGHGKAVVINIGDDTVIG